MKPSQAKTKGRETENLLVEWLQTNGWPNAERRRLAGADDRGDIAGMHNVTVEVKSAAQWTPVEWCRELEREMGNAGDRWGFVAARPKGRPNPDEWVAIVPLPLMIQLLKAAGI